MKKPLTFVYALALFIATTSVTSLRKAAGADNKDTPVIAGYVAPTGDNSSLTIPMRAGLSISQVVDYTTYIDDYILPTDKDSTAGIQRALNAAGIGGHPVFQCHQYNVSATLHGLPNQNIEGCGPNSTVLYRTSDYGDTLVIGSPMQSALAFSVRGIWFLHSDFNYIAPRKKLNNLATKGAHIHAWHGQGFTIENNWITRLPYGILSEGGSIGTFENNNLFGIWDPMYTEAQEGIAQIWLKKSGNPTSFTLHNNKLSGVGYTNRSVTYHSGDPKTTIVTTTQPVGSKTLLLADGCEDCDIDGGYMGGGSVNNISMSQQPGTSLLDVRIRNIHFDSAGINDIFIRSIAGAGRLFTISGNVFNSEGYTQHAIDIEASHDGMSPSITEFAITGNSSILYAGSPIVLGGAKYGSISGNTLTSFNSAGASIGRDLTFTSGIFMNDKSQYISVTGNMLCGNGGKPYYGIFDGTEKVGGASTVTLVGNANGGCLTGLSK